MYPADDSALLRDYCDNHSNKAFAELVGRYINLVYSVAVRLVASPHHAEEIAQAVFIILARKAASLRHDKALGSWLFQTTHLTANNFIRSEMRRHHREQEAYMRSTPTESDASVWKEIAPLLDTAVARLNEKDRRAIVLRFYEGRDLDEVGAALGANEAAAKKRISRALEKLRTAFTQHGVTSTAETIAGTISANSVQTAPLALAKTVTAVAVAKGAAASTSTLTLIKGALKIMAWSQTKAAITAGTLLVFAAGTSIVIVKEAHARKAPALTADTFPQTPAELDAWYVQPPAGQNAATFDLQGIKAMQIQGADQDANLPILGKLPPPSPSHPLSPSVESTLATFIQRNRQALQFFSEGAQYDQSRYPTDLSQGSAALLPYLTGVKRATQLEQMAANLDANNNDEQKATANILNAMALVGSLRDEPILISQLVRVADISMAVDALNYAVNRTTLSANSLYSLSQTFQNAADYDARGDGFNRAMVGEKVDHNALLQNRDQLLGLLNQPGSFGQTQAANNQLIQYVNHSVSLQNEQDQLETTFQKLMAARQEDFPNRLKDVTNVVKQGIADAQERGLLLNELFWGGLDDATIREARNLAGERLAMTAIALEQFRAAHGKQYPDSLSQLTPAYLDTVPTNPFNNQPLRYQKLGKRYRLSCAVNNGNITFSVTMPPPM